ncbi:Autoinducer 2 kinase LsrK [Frondihabitans sp. 762G35]|uniref:FGGY-family carbohydrate kinase n=1 Tax=Frondihabitans sp. 762G35 TaxID=1446794 RepID=UPI000D2088C6|nr:FGGY-family carbohydrate kinase [Frondihabitans sp. 762G35]ARC57745.1 Autoinducer 2 kinase LsrK [Frondihabitans sp. 762G35]
MTRYLVGIDNGSQSTKVTVFDEDGRVVSEGRRPLRPAVTPRPGVVEHPDDDLWSSVGEAAQEALRGFPGSPSDIEAVGLCTIRFCRAMLRADGSLAHPVLSWMDDRVSAPYRHLDDSVARVTTSSGYLTHRLTGEFRDTNANYQGRWPIDTTTGHWLDDGPAFDAFGLRRDQLVDLVAPGEVLGRVTAEAAERTGLPLGLPVVATANDKAVEALGSGLRAPDEVLLSLGTYIAAMAVGTDDVREADHFWTNSAAEPGAHLYESAGIRRGMWTVSWFRDLFPEAADEAARAGRSLEDVLGDEAAAAPAGAGGLLTVLDWLAPTERPHRRGAFLGFDGRQGRGHLYRSILEGIALTMADRSAAMAAELGRRTERVVVAGGGSRSALMMQILADVTGVETVRNAVGDGAGLGAAICGAVATGVHPSFAVAQEAMVRERDRFRPDPAAHALYRRLLDVHRDAAAATDSLNRRLHALEL